MRAEKHPQQSDRLRSLERYGILDTPRESDYDQIVELASQICETPISVINIIDESRQWFKAEVGLGVRETPVETSICSHVILQDDFVEIPDTLADPRMADNPLCLDDPGLRFYAGARLIGSDGLPLGTLCVLDNHPRSLTDLQRKALRVLAKQVMKQFELQRALRNEEILRAEMDHRIKNSLQATSSMIRLYLRNVEDETARDALSAVQRRIDGMSALHEQLQNSSASGRVEMNAYIDQLMESLRVTTPHGIVLNHTVDPVSLPFSFASDIGIILSEFVANSIKHGFKDRDTGKINIQLTSADDNSLQLVASDNGAGSTAPPPEPSKIGGIGSSLVAAAASKLGGTLSNDLTPDGARLNLLFDTH
ncbi:GAF domain-containing protein [Sulfitobacter sp. F26169L]|uniref:histidine kinase dimerization/phosphoacceptor domain -containing protein n=1 Tax=Sulfitobacter sp. F26169L TaxID=2996015 RepID=UPI002260B08B|nr:histidine kinase dimerization/phosphoacceptor domain -containing protein [Sulfitobacter sp. F26169L]MCX7565997.1 GAF domain-containing protein [Sulfitobacter sp. F26169L]